MCSTAARLLLLLFIWVSIVGANNRFQNRCFPSPDLMLRPCHYSTAPTLFAPYGRRQTAAVNGILTPPSPVSYSHGRGAIDGFLRQQSGQWVIVSDFILCCSSLNKCNTLRFGAFRKNGIVCLCHVWASQPRYEILLSNGKGGLHPAQLNFSPLT